MLLMIPRQVRSTLFPYTTLFRSQSTRPPAEVAGRWAAADVPFTVIGVLFRRAKVASSAGSVSFFFIQDRKSTRLNSSHTVISYAVFCLKKKMMGRIHIF